MRKIRRHKWFLEKRRALVQYALMDNGILGAGGGEKNLGVRGGPLHSVGQFPAAHVRHDHIRKKRINVAGIAPLFNIQGFDAIRSREDRCIF
jgi:hypothetical protein